MKFYIQQNISINDFNSLKDIIENLGMEIIPFFHIPFSDEYPNLDFNSPLFIYAASIVTDKIYSDYASFAGVFAHTSDINIKDFFNNSLNKMWSNPIFMGKLKDIPMLDEKEYFVRPIIDSKWFAGTILSSSDILHWIKKLQNIGTDMDTEILIAPINYPENEYRMFYVDGKIVTSSLYRNNMNTISRRGAPQEIHDFALEFIIENKNILPQAFVIDVACSKNKIGIIEINGINNSGFYDIDKESLVIALKNLCEKKHYPKNKII